MSFKAEIGIIGGSGFYQLDLNAQADQTNYLDILTPYSEEPVRLFQEESNGNKVLFLPRHGIQHNLPPHKINYRANIWALNEAGVKKIIAVNAVGGINQSFSTGSIVIPDQIIDYTWGREHTFFDGLGSLNDHVDFTFPYDADMRDRLLSEAANINLDIFGKACFACTQGPRLETAAEIMKLNQDGCDIVGMTGMPEASLARELKIAYACIALVVNPAAGLSNEVITIENIKAVLESGLHEIRKLLNASLMRF